MKRFLKINSLFLAAIVLILSAASVNAATFVVNTTADTADASAGNGTCADASGNCSLRAAISEANALAGADIITLPAGTYTQTLVSASDNANAGGDFDITSDITINGAGAGSTFVEAAATSGTATERVFHIRGAATTTTIVATLDGMTIRNGRNSGNVFGAGIRIDQGTNHNITLSNLNVTQNLNGSSGGGISVSGATTPTLSISNSTITGNSAGSAVAGTTANGAGVQINTTANVSISNTTISNNTSNNAIASSTAGAFGGGIIFGGPGGTNSITNSTISGNSVTISGAGATAAAFAGGIYNQQTTLTISNSTISNNTVSNTVTPTSAFHAGIRTLASTAAASTTITNSTISNNTAGGEGGGVINIAGSTFNSTTNITGSTVSGNSVTSATGVGSGVENFSSSTGLAVVNLTNSTVSGNSTPGSGGGVYNSGTAATVNLNYATVASNTGTTAGGGLFQNTNGTTNLKNSIVADNVSGASPDISGTITSQDYNHVENTTGGTFFAESPITFLALANDVTGTDPQLGALANNGGSTQTQLPASTSPVVNTIPSGTSDCGTTITADQRGIARPQSTACEKGATEIRPTAANAFIAGRVKTAAGRGITNVVITISGGDLTEPRQVKTTSFGYYRIDGLAAGETYVMEIRAKRFTFAEPTRVIGLTQDLADIDFVSVE